MGAVTCKYAGYDHCRHEKVKRCTPVHFEWHFEYLRPTDGLRIAGSEVCTLNAKDAVYRRLPLFAPRGTLNACCVALLMDKLAAKAADVPFLKKAKGSKIEILAIGLPEALLSLPGVKRVMVGAEVESRTLCARVGDETWLVHPGPKTPRPNTFHYYTGLFHLSRCEASTNSCLNMRTGQMPSTGRAPLPDTLEDVNELTAPHQGLKDTIAAAQALSEVYRAHRCKRDVNLAVATSKLECDPFAWGTHGERRKLVIVWKHASTYEVSTHYLNSMVRWCHHSPVAGNCTI